MDSAEKYRRRIGMWRFAAILLAIAFLIVLVVLVVIVVKNNDDTNNEEGGKEKMSMPCPPAKGGLVTSGDPEKPGPFHDLTKAEFERLYRFLRGEPKMNLTAPSVEDIVASSVFMVDLLVPAKQDVLRYLDNNGQQPPREARVVMFRGDKSPPVVEEWRVGPLSQPTYAELLVSSQRRNPVPFSIRPLGGAEFVAIYFLVMRTVDNVVGHVLTESYGGKFHDCGDTCLTFYPAPIGTGLIGHNTRQIWLSANYPAEYKSLYPLDFGIRVDLNHSDPREWRVINVWYSGTIYSSLEDLAHHYDNVAGTNKTRVPYVYNNATGRTAQKMQGRPTPDTPQRPPHQVEPDGKRYTITHRHVKYMDWNFDFRLSSFTGPQVYDVTYRGERIAYELGLSEIAVFYAGHNPVQRVVDFVDSGALIGTHSKSLIPGSDCPENAVFLNVSFLGEGMIEATTLQRAICVFEHDMGVPLRRHMSYARGEGAFYGGMADTALVVRSILTIVNYDYIVDFVFHQSGAIEVRAISTGYILSTFYRDDERSYGFRLDDNIIANLHHHMFNFKVDLDIGGTSNRYETLDITRETVPFTQMGAGATYRQIRFDRHLYNTEEEAVYKYNFDTPRYHLVHNHAHNTRFGDPKAYRIHLAGMSKQLLSENMDNEASIPWARQQLAVTVQKDDEQACSSPYAMFDSLNPVINFTNYISDESIVDKDLVFWVTMGTHHIPHTEDLPVTPTVGGQLSFFLLPYNYFPECPSVTSRDNIRVTYAKENDPTHGLHVERNGNKANDQCGALTLEQLAKERPDDIVQTNNDDFKLL